MAVTLPMHFYAIAAFGVFFVGLSKAGFGGSIGSLAMPLVASVSDILTAITILLPAYVVIDVVVAWLYRRDVRWHILWQMLVPGMIGIVLGAIFFRAVNGAILGIILGVIVIFTALRFARDKLKSAPGPIGERQPTRWDWPRAFGWMGGSGFLSFFLMGGAPAQLYLLHYRLPPQVFVGLLVWFFFLVNAAKMPVLLGQGLITWETLKVSALLLPAIPLGVAAGRAFVTRVPVEPFYIIAHVLLFVLGVYLISTSIADIR